jgi:hypothetical protein
MSTLWASPYSLTQWYLVTVEIRAHNAIGWGAYSSANSIGALVQTVPSQMSIPTRGSSTSSTQIEVDWSAMTNTV